METFIDKKFYVPNISEFYIGFEYEWSEFGRKIWIDEIADQDDVLLAYSSYEETPDEYINEYRVKYLDREDIESFGFKCNTFSESKFMYGKFADEFSIKIKHNDFFIKYFYDDNHLIIAVHNNEMMDSGEESILFNGVVKNKSELKVILKQVRIINE